MKNIVFLHNPKTGGETINELLKIKKNHSLAADRKKELQDKYSFAFVRHPVSRIISWYNHLIKDSYFKEIEHTELSKRTQCYNMLKNGNKMGPHLHRILAEKNDINTWIKIMLTGPEKYQEPCWGPLGQQHLYTHEIYKNNGIEIPVQLVTDIYFFENYQEELKKLLKKINREDIIPKIDVTNKSLRKNVELNEESKKLIYEYFKMDFKLFGFTENY